MYLTVSQKDLKAAMNAVQAIAPGKARLPIFQQLVLRADATGLTVHACNDESSLCYRLPATVQADGVTLLPVHPFAELVQDLPAAPITLIVPSPTDPAAVQVRCQHVKADLKQMALPIEEFPPMPSFATRARDLFLIDGELLREIVAQVAFAAATDSARPVLQGVRIALDRGQAWVSAANAFRLAVRTIAIPDQAASAEVIVPAQTLLQMAHLLPPSGAVHLALAHQGQMLLHTPTIDLAIRVVVGAFPDFRSLLHLEAQTRVVLPTQALAAAVHLMRPFSRAHSHLLHLSIRQERQGKAAALVLEAQAPDLGANEIALTDAVLVEGTDLSVQVDERWLGEALATIPTPQVALAFVSATQPLVLRPVGPLDLVHVMMPRLGNGSRSPATSTHTATGVPAVSAR